MICLICLIHVYYHTALQIEDSQCSPDEKCFSVSPWCIRSYTSFQTGRLVWCPQQRKQSLHSDYGFCTTNPVLRVQQSQQLILCKCPAFLPFSNFFSCKSFNKISDVSF